jgi:hypothetical protein
MRPLPFYDDELSGGFMMMEGILRVEKGKLHFEFHKKDAVMEVVKSGVKTAEIDLKDIDLIEYKKKLFGARLIIHAKRATVFEDLPGNDLTTRTLKVKRKHRDIAANIASNLNLYLSERKLKELDGDME